VYLVGFYYKEISYDARSHECMNISYNVIIIFFLHVSDSLVAILKKLHCKGWIYLDIADVCAPMQGFKMLSLKTTLFKHVGGIMCV
jgi:hypothetical protein